MIVDVELVIGERRAAQRRCEVPDDRARVSAFGSIRGECEQRNKRQYSDADAVIEEALRLLDERDRLAWLRQAVDEADAEFARGEFVEWTSDFLERLKREAEEDSRLGRPIPDEVKP